MVDNQKDLQAPQILESEVVFQQFFGVRRERLHNHRNQTYDYFSLIVPAHSISIFARTPEGKLVLNKEYRHPTGKVLLGPPGGYIDSNEAPEIAAARELLEETGYTAENYRYMGGTYPFSGISGQKVLFITAENAKKTAEPNHEPAESIVAVEMSLQEIRQAILSGHPVDGQLCAGLYLLNET